MHNVDQGRLPYAEGRGAGTCKGDAVSNTVMGIVMRPCAEGDEGRIRGRREERLQGLEGAEGQKSRGRRPRDQPVPQASHRVLSLRRETLGRELSALVVQHDCIEG